MPCFISEDNRDKKGNRETWIEKLEYAGWKVNQMQYSITNPNSNTIDWLASDYSLIWLWTLSYDKIVYISPLSLVIQDIDDFFNLAFWDTSGEPFAATSNFIAGDSEQILKDPSNYKVSKYTAPLLYVYAIIMFFITNPLLKGFENETRYVMNKVFNISATSKDLSMYIDRLKGGGTRRKLSFNHDDDLYL
jgi:hypothetical protein